MLAIFEHFTAADFEASGGTRFHWVKVLTSSSVKEWNSLTTLGLLWLKDKRICKGHFKPEDLHENGQVKVGALPTVGTAAVSVTAPVTATPTREPPRTGLSSAERQDRKRTLDTRRFDDYIGGATESLEEVLGELNTSIRAIQALPGESYRQPEAAAVIADCLWENGLVSVKNGPALLEAVAGLSVDDLSNAADAVVTSLADTFTQTHREAVLTPGVVEAAINFSATSPNPLFTLPLLDATTKKLKELLEKHHSADGESPDSVLSPEVLKAINDLRGHRSKIPAFCAHKILKTTPMRLSTSILMSCLGLPIWHKSRRI